MSKSDIFALKLGRAIGVYIIDFSEKTETGEWADATG